MKSCKVCVVGRMGVGKTSLLIRFIEDRFNNESPTVGVSFYSKKYDGIDLHLWDTAGQERFECLIPSYLRNARIVLICTAAESISELEEDIAHYKDKLTNDGVVIIVIKTKFDIGLDDSDDIKFLTSLERYDHLRDYCNKHEIPFITTSSKTGWGMHELEKNLMSRSASLNLDEPMNNIKIETKPAEYSCGC